MWTEILFAVFSVIVLWAILAATSQSKRINQMVRTLDLMADHSVVRQNVNPLKEKFDCAQQDDPELYILDFPFDFPMWLAAGTMNATLPWEIDPIKEGYDELANFFRTRKMYSLIIPKDQFIREWSEGVENTQSGFITDESGKRREFFQRGCPVSEFTEIVDLIRTTARRTVPCAVYSIKSCHGDTYSVGVSRGRVTFVMFGAEILS